MALEIKKIVNAWITSFNPDENEKALAEKRFSICSTCEFNKKTLLGVETCSKCGCPLSKKVFTSLDYTTCPIGKWDEVDKEYRKNKHSKYKII